MTVSCSADRRWHSKADTHINRKRTVRRISWDTKRSTNILTYFQNLYFWNFNLFFNKCVHTLQLNNCGWHHWHVSRHPRGYAATVSKTRAYSVYTVWSNIPKTGLQNTEYRQSHDLALKTLPSRPNRSTSFFCIKTQINHHWTKLAIHCRPAYHIGLYSFITPKILADTFNHTVIRPNAIKNWELLASRHTLVRSLVSLGVLCMHPKQTVNSIQSETNTGATQYLQSRYFVACKTFIACWFFHSDVVCLRVYEYNKNNVCLQ